MQLDLFKQPIAPSKLIKCPDCQSNIVRDVLSRKHINLRVSYFCVKCNWRVTKSEKIVVQ